MSGGEGSGLVAHFVDVRMSFGHYCGGGVMARDRARTYVILFFIIEVPKGHPQPGSPKDGPCKGPNEVRLNTECTPRVHSSRIVFLFFVAHGPLRSPAR